PGPAMMVGDGINDAPAFAAAFCAGTPAMDRPVLPARADFCFRTAQAGAVRALFEVAEAHARIVRTNLALALLYNTTTLVLCFAAAMTPVLCAVLMPISSAALVLHTSLRLQPARRPS
ncbi:MAG: heavy metal translocating P-type ATPase, partial [Planctomycetota bacterium]